MDTPKYILEKIRQRLNLEEDDETSDNQINLMTPFERLQHVTGWELGSESWADQILEWAKDCGFIIKGE